MEVLNFNLSNQEIQKIKKELKDKKKSSLRLGHEHMNLNGQHRMLLDKNNAEKVKNLISRNKKIPMTLQIYDGKGLSQNKIVGGFIPIVLAGIGAISGVIGAVAAAATAYKDWKHKNVEEAETHRHNLEIEKGLKNVRSLAIGRAIKCTKKKKKSRR